MSDLIKNYKTNNMLKDAAQKNWCITPVLGKPQQITLQLNNGKSFEYICRYNVTEGAAAIVGREFPYDSSSVDDSAHTGEMGIVTSVLPKLTSKRSCADEIDFVFIENPQKKDLKQCADFLASGHESYEKTLLMAANCTPIRPITYHIQKILTAASVLAHRELTDGSLLELAMATIAEKKHIDPKMLKAYSAPFDPRIGIHDIHIPDPNVEEAFAEIEDQLGDDAEWYDYGILDEMCDVVKEFISLDIVNDHVNKYSHLGAVAIMVRGGFKNLLEAYLSANPPIGEFLAEAKDLLQDIGHPEVYALL